MYNMLRKDGDDSPARALKPERLPNAPIAIPENMGGEDSLMNATPLGFIARFVLRNMINYFVSSTQNFAFCLDDAWIANQKEKDTWKRSSTWRAIPLFYPQIISLSLASPEF